MNYIGIDMSKNTFHAAFSEFDVKVFANTKEGIAEFIREMRKRDYACSETLLGVEATGVYHLFLCVKLSQARWPIRVINPLLSHWAIKTSSLRRMKNDRKDAISIRQTLMNGAGYLFRDTPEILTLKAMTQERSALVSIRAKCKQWQHAYGHWQLASDRKLGRSFPRLENRLTQDIKKLDEQMSEVEVSTQKLLRSIPGIGQTSATSLIAHIGDINRFDSPEKLTAYLGLDCRVHESGSSIHGKGYISKRGNSHLRSLLFRAAFIAQRYNPALKRYFEKKKAEGKHHFSALCAVERKLVHLIYAVWKRGTPFEKR